MRPWRSTKRSTVETQSASTLTSPGSAHTSSSAAVFSSTSARRPVIATSAPSARKAAAIARPIPTLPPVTSAFLPFSSITSS